MSLASNQNSNSFGNGSLELLVKLVDTDSVHEIENILFTFHTFENNCDTKTDENVIVGWACSNLKFIDDVLFGDQKLDLCPWKTHRHTTFFLNSIESTVLGDNSISSFRTIIN
jgi:hypothetical protein